MEREGEGGREGWREREREGGIEREGEGEGGRDRLGEFNLLLIHLIL